MPRTDTDEIYVDGVLQNSKTRQVSDEEIRIAETIPANLKNAIATLRQWSTDAGNVNWAAMSQAQKDATMQATFNRLSTFFARFADLLENLGH